MFNSYTTLKSIAQKKSNLIETIRKEFLAKLIKEYRCDDNETISETISKMFSLDNGEFFTSIISFLNARLYTPELANILEKNILDEKNAFTNSKTCVTRVIAKKYTSINDLTKDNNNDDVYFDKDYDTTPYELLKKYKDSQEKMSAADFLDYIRLVKNRLR